MPTVTNFSDVVTQGNTTATGNLTVQGTGISSFTSPLSGVTMAGTLAVTGVTTHASNIVPSVDLVCGIGTAGTRFGNIFSANTNVYNTANLFTANIWSVNVTNISTFQNSVYHFGNTFATGFTQTTGVIIPTTTGISGLGGPSLLFANAFLQTANIGSATAQMAMNVTGNVYVSNSVNVANVLAVTVNASYMNIITSGYANMASINVFTGANATVLTVQTLANVYGTANIVTSNTQTANIVTANVQNLNVSTGANVSYLNVTFVANVNTANLLTTNVQSANIVTANVQNLNVSTGANVSYLNVAFIANVNTANLLTTNVQSANIVTANVQNLNVSTGANVSYLNVTFVANVNTANLLTTNVQSANIVTANVQNLNVSTGANVSYLNVAFIANVNTANLLTTNVQSANIVTANVQNLNVSTGANVSYLNVAFIANVNTANILTMNLQSANIVTANVQNLNVSTGANVSYLNVTFVANVNTANILTANIASANIVTANVSNLNTYSANVTSLFVQTFANILSSNIVSTFSSNVNVAAFANVFTANIYRGNVQSTMNVSGLLSGTLLTGNASALMNINASNVTMGVLPFRNDGAIGLGATAISINGSTGIANQYLSSTGTSLQWVGPPAAIFSQVPTSTNQIFYNSGNVAIGVYNWTQFGVGYNTYPGVPLDVYGGSGSFSNVSDAYQTGTIRIMQNAASWGGNGGLEFKTGTNIAGAGHRIVTTEVTSSSGIAPLIFQYRANTPVWSNAMVIHNGSATPGYVGIGTMTPLFNLHIYQLSNTNPATMTVQMSNTGQSSQLYLSNASGTTTQLYLNGPNLSSDGPANSATLRNNAGDLRLAAASTNPYIYLQNSTSNVGINTTTATQTLDVAGYTRVGSTTSDTARLILGRAPGTTNFDYASMIESVSTFATNYQSTLRFYTHGTATTGADPTLAMTINPTQQVGIGIAPSYKFHVDNTSTSGINAVIQASTITAGSTTSVILGKALSANNSATFVWNHVGEGLATNYLGIGFYGGDNRLCVTSNASVGVGITNPGGVFQVNASVINPTRPTVHIGDNANDYGATYGMVHLVRNATPGDTKAHLTMIRNGNTGVNFGFWNNTNTFGIWPNLGNTGATPTISITTGSFVGIGTASPVARLDVWTGTARSGTVPASYGSIYATADAGGGTTYPPVAEFRHSNQTQGIGINFNAIFASGSNAAQDLQLHPKGASQVAVYGKSNAGGYGHLLIDYPNAGAGGGCVTIRNSSGGNGASAMLAFEVDGSTSYDGNAQGNGHLYCQNLTTSYPTYGSKMGLIIWSGSAEVERQTWLPNGLVGINQTSPSYTLDVNGNFRAGTTTIITGNEIAMQYYNTTGGASKYVGVSGTNYCTGGMEIESTTLGGNYSQKVHFWSHYYGSSVARRMTITESGNVGVGLQSPAYKFEVSGRSYFWGTSLAGGGQNQFTGLDGDGTANGRAQVVLNSSYSDLVISSSQANGTHGSTISFVANSTANNDYRKFVINVGNWAGYGSGGYGDRMSFGWQNVAYSNPHNYVSPSNCTLMLDGRNKRVGINNVDSPGYNLQINGNDYASGARYSGEYFRNVGSGNQGLVYNEHFDGGWYMADTTFVRVNSNKWIYTGGNITAGSDIIAYYSDMRLKKNIVPIVDALDKIKTLSTFTYETNELGASFGLEEHVRNTGFSAQEVQKIMPEVVRLAPFDMGSLNEVTGVMESKSGENYMTLLYDKMAPLIVAALKEEVQKREDLEKEVAELKQLVQNLLAKQ